MEKRKVLYVITQTEWGGAQKYTYDLITSNEAQNYDITVAVGNNRDKSLIEKLRAIGVKVVELKHLVRAISPLNDTLAVFELISLFKYINPDIIHTSSSKPSIICSYAFRLSDLKNSKLIHTVHGWAFNENIGWILKKIYQITEKLTAKYKSTFIFLSELDKKSAKENRIKIKNSVTIYNGIDDEGVFLDKETARKELGLPMDKIIIGTIANFYKTKGLEYFIKAIRELNNNNFVGVVIGDGDLRTELENLIKELDIKNNFLLLGKKDNASKYLKAYDIYISSSTKEGLPYSILEAMSAKLPIIATEVGGIPEIINHQNGILVKSGDYKNMTEKIKYLTDNNDLSLKLSEQANQDVREKFSKENMIQTTFNLYK